MSWPQPTRADHDKFCRNERWVAVRDARGRTGTHHVTYHLTLPDGRILRTRISHPPDRTDYGDGLWQHILRDQLHVSEREFWACVRDGVRPERGLRAIPEQALPAELVHLLLTKVGLSEADVLGMSKAEAIERLQKFWSEGG